MSLIGYEIATGIGGGKTIVAMLPGLTILTLGGIIVWQLWKKKISQLDQKNVKTSDKLTIAVNRLITENNELSKKINHLQTKISTLQPTTISQKSVTLDSLINESVKVTKNSSKLAMLKQIVADNVALRTT
ncbi:MAG: hypothetical protein KAH84_06615 [Thiomargarita sp.]|nr:hypothetical protein [Thiomargarita sp.]